MCNNTSHLITSLTYSKTVTTAITTRIPSETKLIVRFHHQIFPTLWGWGITKISLQKDTWKWTCAQERELSTLPLSDQPLLPAWQCNIAEEWRTSITRTTQFCHTHKRQNGGEEREKSIEGLTKTGKTLTTSDSQNSHTFHIAIHKSI